MRSLTGGGSVIVFALVVTACASGGQAMRASLQGKSLRYDQVSGKLCDHCAGTQMVLVGAGREGTPSLHFGFDFAACKYGIELAVSPDGGAELSYGEGAQAERAEAGRIRCHTARPDWVDFSFWGTFRDGKRIEGRARTRLTFDAGYD
jgi:hypothetical protein